jgi:hypothetical protein
VKVEVSLTIPMNMLPMLGSAILIAWGSVTEKKIWLDRIPSAQPASV